MELNISDTYKIVVSDDENRQIKTIELDYDK